MAGDVVTLETDFQAGQPLIVPVMCHGRRLAPSPSMSEARRVAADNLARLPHALAALEDREYPVEIAPALQELAREVDRHTGAATRLKV